MIAAPRGRSGRMPAPARGSTPVRHSSRGTLPTMSPPEPRHLLTAELLSVGTELTVGDTRDTNAGAPPEWSELCRALFNLNDFVYVN